MLVVTILLAVAAVGLGVQLVRTHARLDALSSDLGEAMQARESADAARRLALAEAADARKERDDALERANRARRDAADVAKRMKQEADARGRAEAALAEAVAAASGDGQQAEQLWALALASVRRTWEVSVAPSPGMPSPLDGSDDELRDAVGIEVAAAREEAGAAIDLEWSGETVTAPALAVRTLALAQELVGRLAKATGAAVLHVRAGADAVTLEVTGTGTDGQPAPVDQLLADVAPEHQVAPGRFELAGQRQVRAGARAERPGR